MSSLINIYSLPKKKTIKEDNRLKIYETVLRQCHHRIKTTSNNYEEYTFFTIPNVIPGMPIFDTLSCCDYIMRALSDNGFKILNLGANFIFITWAHINFSAEKERRMEERILKLQELRELDSNNTNCIGYGQEQEQYPKLIDNEIDNRYRDNKNNKFRPIYDTPSTEKYLMT